MLARWGSTANARSTRRMLGMKRTTHTRYQTIEPELLCECWCRWKMVMVPRDEVLAGRTRSCGAPKCQPPGQD